MFTCTDGYQYTEDLLALDHCRPQPGKEPVQERLRGVCSPLVADHWEEMLAHHPDRRFVEYLMSGIKEGFRIGFRRLESEKKSLSSARKNMYSTVDYPHVVRDYLRDELKRGTVLGPFVPEEVPEVHLNRFGVIPKSHQPGKWRLIVDLSHPDGRSVNDGISSELCSLCYTRVDQVVRQLLQLGPGALMAKLDIKSAYRIVPVHPQDRFLLGMKWEDRVFVDRALPFGLRSAPKIFNAVADALEWIVKDLGVQQLWHYLDDYITCGAPESDECQSNLQMLVDVCRHLGVPLANEKLEGPTTCLVFLGILIDTIRGELRLPQEKLDRLRAQIEEWLQKRKCTKQELLSIAGQLQHAATVVWPGRVFVRRLFDLSATVRKASHHVYLNLGARSDLAWWREFLAEWNGVSMLSALGDLQPSITLTSDASGSWGCGAYWGSYWFQLAWSDTACCVGTNIATKELIPIVIAAAMWGQHWTGQVVCCRCDNSAVVSVLNHRTSRDSELMHLLRCLTFFEARCSCRLVAAHILGSHNTLADNLSRNNSSGLLQAVGNTSMLNQSVPPQPLLDMLVNSKPDWTSAPWRKMFRDTLNRV